MTKKQAIHVLWYSDSFSDRDVTEAKRIAIECINQSIRHSEFIRRWAGWSGDDKGENDEHKKTI